MSVALTVPQWSVGTTISLFQLSGSLVWQNPTVMTGEPYYGSMFSNTSNTMFLTGNYVAFSTPGTLFTLLDSSSNAYQVTLTVVPPKYTLSSAGVVFVGDSSTNLPITLTAPTNVSATVVVNGLIPGPSNVISRTISASFTDYNFAPSLPGGLLSSIDSSGNVSITGLPTTVRAQTTYAFYGRTSINQTTTNDVPLQVKPPRYQFSNVSGAVVVNTSASAVLTYKTLNNIVVGVAGMPGTLTASGVPPGMSIRYSGNIIDLSGIPTQFGSSTLDVVLKNFAYSTKFSYSLTMTPCLEIILPPTATVYSNVPYTVSSPMVTASIRGYPINVYSVSSSSLTISQNGAIFGTLDANRVVTVTASGNGLSNEATVAINTIADTVTFGSYTAKPIYQNVAYSNTFVASASSGQPLAYSVVPIFDGPIGLTLNASTGVVTGTPRGVSALSNYTMKAITPQGISGTLPIVLSIVPDYITIQGVSSLSMIQGYPILQRDYLTIQFDASANSGDRIGGFLYSNFPSGVSITENGLIRGTPLVSGNYTGTVIVRSINGVTATTPLTFNIAKDALILPRSTDFVVASGSNTTFSLSGYAFSTAQIVSYSVSAAGVTVTNNGELTIQSTTYQVATPFTIFATTSTGITLSAAATLTVNDPNIGEFLSPNGPILLPYGSTYPIVTKPNNFFFVSYSTNFGISGSSLIKLSPGDVYPPELVLLKATINLWTPVRISTLTFQPVDYPTQHWIQYVPIQPITFVTPGVFYIIPEPPPGMRWNPLSSTLTGGPISLTIQDSFTVFATDGYTVQSFSIRYSVATPTYLRTFSAPSSYTNYVKQRAFVNAAAHAINGIAYLPDPMIATQTGPYPPDQIKEYRCLTCPDPKPYRILPLGVYDANGGPPFTILDANGPPPIVVLDGNV